MTSTSTQNVRNEAEMAAALSDMKAALSDMKAAKELSDMKAAKEPFRRNVTTLSTPVQSRNHPSTDRHHYDDIDNNMWMLGAGTSCNRC